MGSLIDDLFSARGILIASYFVYVCVLCLFDFSSVCAIDDVLGYKCFRDAEEQLGFGRRGKPPVSWVLRVPGIPLWPEGGRARHS